MNKDQLQTKTKSKGQNVCWMSHRSKARCRHSDALAVSEGVVGIALLLANGVRYIVDQEA